MDHRDRVTIEDLFRKLAEVERRAPPRDPEAEAFIRGRMGAQPAAPYYMAQTIVAQEQALYEAQRRIDELAAQSERRSGGGFLDGLFGGGRPQTGPAHRPSTGRADHGPWSAGGVGGGGFLAGAAQTAMGVAGGVVLGSMLADWLSPDEAAAAGLGEEGGIGGAEQAADVGGFDGGDFDVGDL
jgi:hypothetical protein